MKQYIVDAFTDEVFRGNPAAVCVMDAWPSERWMQLVAAENRLSETAFLVREGEGWRLRWFTPGTEVELCGHATLASASVMLDFYDTDADEVVFDTLSGQLTARRHEAGGLRRAWQWGRERRLLITSYRPFPPKRPRRSWGRLEIAVAS